MSIVEIKEFVSTLSGRVRKELILSCDWCEKIFEKQRKMAENRKKTIHFCSNSCSARYKMKNNPVVRATITNLTRWRKDETRIEEISAKRQKTCVERYGANSPLESKEIQKQCNDTFVGRYDVSNPQQVEEIHDRTKKTCLEKYGTEYQINSILTKAKIQAIFLEKYNATSPAPKKYKIIETDEYLIDWLKRQGEDVPTRNILYRTFKTQQVHLKDVEEMLVAWRGHKTRVEHRASILFETPHYNRKPAEISVNYRPDFKLSDSIYVNVDGLYWHSEHQKDKKYHFDLRKEFEKNHLVIFQFREDEIFNKPDIVKSIALNKLGQCSTRLMARKTTVKSVSQADAKVFLNENHLMGSVSAKHIGLYDKEDKLVSLLSYKRRKTAMNVEQYCSALNYSISGGFSKLLSYLEKNCLPAEITEIHNWVDLRYGTGEHLLSKDFIQRTETLGWNWTDGSDVFNRLKCRANMDDRKLPEKKHAEELEWYRIYDAGQRLYVKSLF